MTITATISHEDIISLRVIRNSNSANYLPETVSLADRILNQVDGSPFESISVTVARRDGSRTTIPLTEQQLGALDLDLVVTDDVTVEVTKETIDLARKIITDNRRYGVRIKAIAGRIVEQLPYVITVDRPDGHRSTFELSGTEAAEVADGWRDAPRHSHVRASRLRAEIAQALT